MGSFKVGQVCTNGHPITGNAKSGFGSPHCPECGALTITHCPSCQTTIRGKYETPNVLSFEAFMAPAHCHQCGAAYPWTQAKLDAVKELAGAIDELTDFERGELAELMPHLVQETPRTKPAGFKVATILSRMKGPGKAALRELMMDIAVDAGKAALGF